MEKASTEEIRNFINRYPSWQYKEGKIVRDVKGYPPLVVADLLHQIVNEACRVNHHPKVLWNFDDLRIELSTHDVSGVSIKDFDFATAIEKNLQSKGRVKWVGGLNE